MLLIPTILLRSRSRSSSVISYEPADRYTLCELLVIANIADTCDTNGSLHGHAGSKHYQQQWLFLADASVTFLEDSEPWLLAVQQNVAGSIIAMLLVP